MDERANGSWLALQGVSDLILAAIASSTADPPDSLHVARRLCSSRPVIGSPTAQSLEPGACKQRVLLVGDKGFADGDLGEIGVGIDDVVASNEADRLCAR